MIPWPLEKKRYRSRKKGVSELNEWEVKQRQPKFAGTITKKDSLPLYSKEDMDEKSLAIPLMKEAKNNSDIYQI